ncbi:MAG: hypothetical protein ACE148_03600 [Vicinamibacterales bacterium]
MTIELDMLQAVAPAAIVLFIHYGVRRRFAVLDRYDTPAPVVGATSPTRRWSSW